MPLIDEDEFRLAMARAGVSSPTRESLIWLTRRIELAFDAAVEAAVARLTRTRDPMED